MPALDLAQIIENAARDGFKQQGRGLVACMENTKGKIEHVIYVPNADASVLFAEHLGGVNVAQWLQTYDTDREYILMNIVQENEIEALAEPHLCLYRNRKTLSV